MKFIQKYSLLTLAILVCTGLFAQKDKKKDLPSESVDVVKDFDARLLETNKLDVLPLLPALDTATKKQDYVVPPKILAVKYEAPKLRPVGIKSTSTTKVYNGYLKAGAGIPTSFYGEAGYYLGGKKFDGKIWAKHHSANYKSLDNQRFANNDAAITGNYYLTQSTAVEGKLAYSYDRVHFYGYNHDDFTYTKGQTRQDFKLADMAFRLYNSARTDADLHWSVAPKFYFLTDYYAHKETGFDMTFAATKWFAEKHPLKVAIRTDFTRFKDKSVDATSLSNIHIMPSFTFHNDLLELKLGGNFVNSKDVISIFPDAALTVRVWGDGFQIFGGATGDLRKNTFRTLTEYNPYITGTLGKLKNTKFNTYYGGIKGNLGFLEYSGQLGLTKATNVAMFLPDSTILATTGISRFNVLYDSLRTFNIQGTVKFNPIKDLTITGTLSQSVFTPENQAKAWGLPGLEGNFSARYNLLDGKAAVKAECYLADRISYRTADFAVADKSKALVDFSLGGEYLFMENVGAFLDINNLFNNKRERWYLYPTYGTNLLVGITARF